MDIAQKELKGYELKERLGTGGFGAVYRAYQTTIGREVAIKVILPNLSSQPDFIRRFEGEAQLVARLEHPHITPLYDYWRDPDGAYLVMRWLRGGSLSDALEKSPFELRAAATLLDQIAGALSLAHRNDIIHRDIKPANILLDEDGNAYLTDFGIAKDLNLTTNGTQPDAIMGSLDYISPEQARSEPVTARTDIYSLGVTMYEVITGKHPFEGLSAIEKLYKHISEPLPEISGFEPDKLEAINRVIQKATQKNPEHRYPDALAFAADFREAIGLNRTSTTMVELLTIREQEILQLIIEGLSNKEIAQKLTVTLGTVKWYIKQIYDKLGVRSRVQAMVRARELHLVVKGENITAPLAIPTEDFHPDNPYKGLLAFQAGDYQDFFGREKVIAKLLKRMTEAGDYQRFLAVLGPSGSGKSSLVKAGLIPALWRGDILHSESWFVVEMLPGARPLDELEIALMKVAANQAGNLHEQLRRDAHGLLRIASLILPDDKSELVLVIDQFEEVFTLVSDEDERKVFLDLLHASVTDPRSRIRIIITLRADFYDRPLHYPAFGDLVRNRLETIMPLSAEELESAISKPAERVGVGFEAGLVAAIVGDVHYQPGALPLLQYALTELFEQRNGHILTREAYQAIGGASGALAKRAEEIYLSLSDGEKELTRQIFLRLVTLGEGTEDTRRRVLRSELLGIVPPPSLPHRNEGGVTTETEGVDAVEELLDGFAAYRLFSLDNDAGSRQPTVEVAHEALIREWERLKAWLNESRTEIQMQRQLSTLASDWAESKGNKSFLLRGSRLTNFEVWAQATSFSLTPPERAFLQASLVEREQEQQTERERQAKEIRLEQRSQNFLRGLVGVFAIAALLAVALSIFAFLERNRAEDNLDYARSMALASAAISADLSNNPDQAIAYAVAAYGVTDNPPSFIESVLYESAIRPATRWVFTGEAITHGIFSPDERNVLSWNESASSIVVWDVESGQVLRRLPELMADRGMFQVIFPPIGETAYAVINSFDFTQGEVVEFDVVTGEVLRNLFVQEGFSVSAMGLSPDGDMLVVTTGTFDGESFVQGPIVTIDVTTGNLVRQLEAESVRPAMWTAVTFSDDGQYVLAGTDNSRALILWDLSSGEVVNTFASALEDEGIVSGYFTSAGIVTVTSSRGDSLATIVSLRDPESGEIVREQSWQILLNGSDLNFDRNRIALGFTSSTIEIFDVNMWQSTHILYGHGVTATSVDFSQDGHSLLSGSLDGELRLWNLESDVIGLRVERVGLVPGLSGLVISPDGYTALTQTMVGEGPMLWSLETGELIREFDETQSTLRSIAFSPDGRYVVSASKYQGGCPDGETELTLTNVDTGEVVWKTRTNYSIGTGIAFINGGHQIAAMHGECSSTVIIWDAASGEQVDIWEGQVVGSWGLAASQDGRLVATGSNDGTAIVRDAATGSILHTLQHDARIRTVAFSPDNNQLLTVADDGILRLWDTGSGELVQQLTGHTTGALFVDFSPNGRYIVSSGRDNNLFVWDLELGEAVRHLRLEYLIPLGHVVAFSPDGNSIFINDENYSLIEIDVLLESGELIDWVLANRYVRELTCSERALYRIEPLCETEAAQASTQP